ncbi:hypothetical protein, partial [Rhodobium orientis]|uniref:hypothetical protein n=1 Tax=Rhodobium orientis TaxID=34017 RepID=UPI001AED293D
PGNRKHPAKDLRRTKENRTAITEFVNLHSNDVENILQISAVIASAAKQSRKRQVPACPTPALLRLKPDHSLRDAATASRQAPTRAGAVAP